jgi:predicted lipid-binding transport protein (Tim44 family)
MEGSGYFDILILAAVAAFLFFRLRNVLGRKYGNEDSSPLSPKTFSEDGNDRVIPLGQRNEEREQEEAEQQEKEALAAISSSALAENLNRIRNTDRTFRVSDFMRGARGAFEMIVEAFSRADRATLRQLLGKPVLEQFLEVLDGREKEGKVVDVTLVSIKESEMIEAAQTGSKVRITVRFVSEQIIIEKDKDGNILDGNPSEIDEVTDEWTFERDLRSSSPDWFLVAT